MPAFKGTLDINEPVLINCGRVLLLGVGQFVKVKFFKCDFPIKNVALEF